MRSDDLSQEQNRILKCGLFSRDKSMSGIVSSHPLLLLVQKAVQLQEMDQEEEGKSIGMIGNKRENGERSIVLQNGIQSQRE